MKISIIIPTHNRKDELKKCLDQLEKITSSGQIEIIVVDNNSDDGSQELIRKYKDAIYVFEKSTAFSKARDTGYMNSTGEILVFTDDDAVIQEGSIAEIVKVFEKQDEVGIIAGRILPEFEVTPPDWALHCQESHNAWSLLDLGELNKEITYAYGPLLAIRRDLYGRVGGFPPDTIGVENSHRSIFKKWYVGPGDVGIARKVINTNKLVLYSPKVVCKHHVTKFRMKPNFWYSRFFGEGTSQAFIILFDDSINNLDRLSIFKKNLLAILIFYFKFIFINENIENPTNMKLDFVQGLSFFSAIYILFKYKSIGGDIWKAGKYGVSKEIENDFFSRIPQSYLEMIETQNNIINPSITELSDLAKKMFKKLVLINTKNNS